MAVFAENGGGYATQLCVPQHRVYPVRPDVPATAVLPSSSRGSRPATRSSATAASPRETSCWFPPAPVGWEACRPAVRRSRRDGDRHGVHRGEARHRAPPRRRPHAAAGPGRSGRRRAGDHGRARLRRGDRRSGRPAVSALLQGARLRGRYIVVGSSSQQPAMLDARALMPRAQIVAGFVMARVAEQDPAEPKRTLDVVIDAQAAGRLRPDVTLLSMDDVVRAHELIESRRQSGKYVIDVSGPAEEGAIVASIRGSPDRPTGDRSTPCSRRCAPPARATPARVTSPRAARGRLVAPLVRRARRGSRPPERRARVHRARAAHGIDARHRSRAGVPHLLAARWTSRCRRPTSTASSRRGHAVRRAVLRDGPARRPRAVNVWRRRDREPLEEDWNGDRGIAERLRPTTSPPSTRSTRAARPRRPPPRDFRQTIDHWQGVYEEMRLRARPGRRRGLRVGARRASRTPSRPAWSTATTGSATA